VRRRAGGGPLLGRLEAQRRAAPGLDVAGTPPCPEDAGRAHLGRLHHLDQDDMLGVERVEPGAPQQRSQLTVGRARHRHLPRPLSQPEQASSAFDPSPERQQLRRRWRHARITEHQRPHAGQRRLGELTLHGLGAPALERQDLEQQREAPRRRRHPGLVARRDPDRHGQRHWIPRVERIPRSTAGPAARRPPVPGGRSGGSSRSRRRCWRNT
jgi:hypothetical protein